MSPIGYYVSLQDVDAIIPTEHLDEAYRRLCALNKRDDLKSGGRYEGGVEVQKWFAWMDPNYPETCPDAASIFAALGFDVDLTPDGLRFAYYDSKTGSEDLFVAAVADLFKPGSYMDWRGEEDAYWRWEFNGTKEVQYKVGRVTWE